MIKDPGKNEKTERELGKKKLGKEQSGYNWLETNMKKHGNFKKREKEKCRKSNWPVRKWGKTGGESPENS